MREYGHLTMLNPDFISNLGIKYASNTFTICDAFQRDLSAENYGLVNMPSITGGKRCLIEVIVNTSFIDGVAASSNIDNNLFGCTAAVAWNSDKPFYLYLINYDDSSANAKFAFACTPSYTKTKNCTKLGNVDGDSQAVMMIMDSSVIPANYDGKPCRCIGAFRMRKNSSDEWTVQALTFKDGISRFHEETQFTFPSGQFTFGSSYFPTTNGPSWATPTNIIYTYSISKQGIVTCNFDTTNAGNCTNGTEVADISFAIPFGSDITRMPFGCKGSIRIGGVEILGMIYKLYTSKTAYIHKTSDNSVINGNEFTNSSDSVWIDWSYQAFNND